jgi:lipoprotein-releasing system permease protein|uniref:Lipoprotein-releasing ABC transporter permease subunit n=1 Tax=Desulfobacca acetoxidans TaxID=60893 RepID=A0A7V6A4D5_9BACT
MGFFETFVALRMLKGVRRQKGFISLSSVFSIAGVAVGVMALIVVIGVMTGFDEDLKSKILSVNPEIIVLSKEGRIADYDRLADEIKTVPGVTTVEPYLYTPVMFSTPGNISGGMLRGLADNVLKAGGPKHLKVSQGSFAEVANFASGEPPPAALGNELARRLNLQVGDFFNLYIPRGTLTPMGQLPRLRLFRVAAIFHSGMYEFDSSLLYVSLPALQDLLGFGHQVTGLEVSVNNIYAAAEMSRAIIHKLGPTFFARDWINMNYSLFSALKLEKIAMFVILTLIILVAAFGIASTLFMMVMKKTKEIAILKSMGATRQSIMRIFVLDGLLIGSFGTALGVILGLIMCGLLQRYEFIKLPRDVYLISTLPVKIQAPDLAAIVCAALLISFLATLYPSWQASRLDPVEAIRYE